MADSLIPDDQSAAQQEILNKWKDKPQDELLKAKVESDLYIKTLTARMDDLKKDYLEMKERQEASAQLKDLIDQMKSNSNNPDTVRTPQDAVNQPAIKPEEIESLVEAKLAAKFTQHQASLRQQENMNLVQGKLKAQLGENYLPAYQQRLDQLGLTPAFADDLARNHPAVFIKTFELEAQPVVNQPYLPRNQQRASTFAPSSVKKDWNYYQEMKKTNPKMYLDRKIANEMHDQAIALGADFGMPLD